MKLARKHILLFMLIISCTLVAAQTVLIKQTVPENFEDIDPAEQSMFMNLNIRNRRQKILHNLSFETEVFDIYDPVYTSEEESNSDDQTYTSESQESSYGTEEGATSSSMASADSFEQFRGEGDTNSHTRQRTFDIE